MPQFALSRVPRSRSAALYAAYTKFEKQHGTRSTLETTVLGKRRIQYEDELAQDGRNYDVWFDYARLEEGALKDLRDEGVTQDEEQAAITRVREVYERAVAQVPPGGEKRHWRRYIFLWLNYALFEEIETRVRKDHLVFVMYLLKLCRITHVQDKFTRPHSNWFHTNNSPSQNCGYNLHGLRCANSTCLPRGRF